MIVYSRIIRYNESIKMVLIKGMLLSENMSHEESSDDSYKGGKDEKNNY